LHSIGQLLKVSDFLLIIIVLLIFIKGNQKAQQFIPLMGYAILYAFGGNNKKE